MEEEDKPHLGLPDLANKNTQFPDISEFQVNNEFFFYLVQASTK